MEFSGANAIQALQVGADGLLNIVKGKTWLTLSPSADQLKTNYVMESGSDECLTGLPGKSPGNDWAGTTKGLHRWKPGGWEAVEPKISADGRWISSMKIAPPIYGLIQNRASFSGRIARDGWQSNWEIMVSLRPPSAWRRIGRGICGWGPDYGLVQLQKRRVRAYTSRDGLTDDNAWAVCRARTKQFGWSQPGTQPDSEQSSGAAGSQGTFTLITPTVACGQRGMVEY